MEVTTKAAGDPDVWKVREWRAAWEAEKRRTDRFPSQFRRPEVTVPYERASPDAPATQAQGGASITSWIFGSQQ